MTKQTTHFVRYWLVVLFIITGILGAKAQISLNPFISTYAQNFDALPSSGTGTWEHGTAYFPGWHLFRTAPVTTTILTGTGTSNYGGLYSFGSAGSSDRALGSISSGTNTVGEFAWGLMIQNNTGKTITSLTVTYTGEQWRSASPTSPQHTLSFWYATNLDPSAFNLSPKTDAGWTNVKELDFWGPVFKTAGGPLNGNAPEYRKTLSAVIPITILPGTYAMLRWKDLNELELDHGLAIDDFSMTWKTDNDGGPGVLPVELIRFAATATQNRVTLLWATASEKDNDHFIVERSQNSKEFEEIATIKGQGHSAVRTNYSFADNNPIVGISYYRLKQVDFDGTVSYSAIVSVKVKALHKAVAYPTSTSNLLHLDIAPAIGQTITLFDITGKLVYQQHLQPTTIKQTIDVSTLKTGSYSLLITNNEGGKQVLRFTKW
jgi:hypothetical protein